MAQNKNESASYSIKYLEEGSIKQTQISIEQEEIINGHDNSVVYDGWVINGSTDFIKKLAIFLNENSKKEFKPSDIDQNSSTIFLAQTSSGLSINVQEFEDIKKYLINFFEDKNNEIIFIDDLGKEDDKAKEEFHELLKSINVEETESISTTPTILTKYGKEAWEYSIQYKIFYQEEKLSTLQIQIYSENITLLEIKAPLILEGINSNHDPVETWAIIANRNFFTELKRYCTTYDFVFIAINLPEDDDRICLALEYFINSDRQIYQLDPIKFNSFKTIVFTYLQLLSGSLDNLIELTDNLEDNNPEKKAVFLKKFENLKVHLSAKQLSSSNHSLISSSEFEENVIEKKYKPSSKRYVGAILFIIFISVPLILSILVGALAILGQYIPNLSHPLIEFSLANNSKMAQLIGISTDLFLGITAALWIPSIVGTINMGKKLVRKILAPQVEKATNNDDIPLPEEQPISAFPQDSQRFYHTSSFWGSLAGGSLICTLFLFLIFIMSITAILTNFSINTGELGLFAEHMGFSITTPISQFVIGFIAGSSLFFGGMFAYLTYCTASRSDKIRQSDGGVAVEIMPIHGFFNDLGGKITSVYDDVVENNGFCLCYCAKNSDQIAKNDDQTITQNLIPNKSDASVL